MSRYNLRNSIKLSPSYDDKKENSSSDFELDNFNETSTKMINEINDLSDKSIFINDYFDKERVFLENVDEDGACLYACLTKGLVYNDSSLVITKKSLMNLCREYIEIHQNKVMTLPNGLKMKFKELIKVTHDIDIERYIKRYTRITAKNWGGLPEILAVSELFNIGIDIYTRDGCGYRREYSIPNRKKIDCKINLLLDLLDEFAHYQLMFIETAIGK